MHPISSPEKNTFCCHVVTAKQNHLTNKHLDRVTTLLHSHFCCHAVVTHITDTISTL